MFAILVNNKLIVIALVVVIGFTGWYALRGGSGSAELLETQDLTTPTSEADRDLVTTLLELRSVSLDGNIFNDPAFRALADFGSQIVPEPVGRSNPFAPLGNVPRTGTTTSPTR